MSGNLLNEDLTLAAMQGDTKRALDLLNQGADFDSLQSGHTALYHASAGGNIELVELLIMRGANVNLGLFTPLGAAINQGHMEIVDLLLRSNADPNLQDALGFTALHYAVNAEREDLVKKLLEINVDCSIISKRGLTALEQAQSLGNVEIEKLITDKIEADRNKRKL